MTEEHKYLDPWSESLYNCTTGSNYLRGSEYHRLIDHLEDLQAKLKEREAQMTRVIEWLQINQSDVFSRGIWDTLRASAGINS